MFSPPMTAEFPTYDEAFAYTQAYAIENGIGLTKKRTNYRERGGPARNQDLCCDRVPYQASCVAYQPVKQNREHQSGSAQTACEYTVRIQYLARGVYKVQEKGLSTIMSNFKTLPPILLINGLMLMTRRISTR